ncbi:MAG TPA: M15 family metallopeptidase [Candidatus Paceibacterota bacterium]
MIIDSDMTVAEALRQNPHSEAPESIVKNLRVLQMYYIGFDMQLHRGQIVVHKKAVAPVRTFFSTAIALTFPIKSVIPVAAPEFLWDDEISCNANNSSGYNYRTIAGTTRLSRHASGLAFDINPLQNVYIRYDADGNEIARLPAHGRYDPDAPGTLHADHLLVILMKQYGWTWGGDWTPESGRVDYQHFEKVL